MDISLYYFVMKPYSNSEGFVTLVPYAIVSSVLLAMQILFMAWYNKLWGEGNVLLITLQVFTFIQFADSILLVWNNADVLYNPIYRVIRYILWAASMIFNFVYMCGFVNLMELLYSEDIFVYDEGFSTMLNIRSDLGDEDTWAIYDVMNAMVTSYLLMAYFPTFLVNLMIFAKEAF